jgi:hypothetical protein
MKRIIVALLIVVAACGGGAVVYADDPGPHVQYGGTPIELHFDSPGANITKAFVDGTPCIILSYQYVSGRNDTPNVPTVAMSCDWSPR